MADVVIDASVWVGVLVPRDGFHRPSRVWLEKHVEEGGTTIAPALILSEVAGPVARRTGSATLGRRAASALRRIPGLKLVAVDRELAEIAEALAATHRLRGADAVYVALARRLDVTLITWDREQLTRGIHAATVRSPEAS